MAQDNRRFINGSIVDYQNKFRLEDRRYMCGCGHAEEKIGKRYTTSRNTMLRRLKPHLLIRLALSVKFGL
jgi:hypothetical protein